MENKPSGKVWTCTTCGAMNIQHHGVCVICGTNKDAHRSDTKPAQQKLNLTEI